MTILVGPEGSQKKFYIHRGVLCFYPKYFDTDLSLGEGARSTCRLEWPDDWSSFPMSGSTTTRLPRAVNFKLIVSQIPMDILHNLALSRLQGQVDVRILVNSVA
jgi:hypothetical protein